MENPKEKKPVIKSKVAEREEEILAFWQKEEIFKKSLEKDSPKGEFVFYDGPPFATGLPHFGNILAGTLKDYIGRYKTMRGYHVPRRWGWDCHGLPVENIVEKEIGLKSKKDIEDFGIEKFNDIARTKIFTYVDDWKKIIPRMGRFVDMENDYRTMNPTFMESVWWVFNELNKKGLVYEGFKSMHYCPHCGTTLANFEVSQGYKDITDLSVIGKFELRDEPGTYFLAWTTTPWTLPGNVALAVNPDVSYIKFKLKDAKETYISSVNFFEKSYNGGFKFVNENTKKSAIFSGSEGSLSFGPQDKKTTFQLESYELFDSPEIVNQQVVGKSYKPLFDYYDNAELKNRENGFKVYPASFVTTEDGTGIVHIAPAFGEDDLNLGNQYKLPFIQHVGTDGKFKKEVKDFAGKYVKPKENPQEADIEVIKYLAGKGTLFAKEKFIHSYPHCYRCDTPLLNYATSSWFVEVTKFKDRLIEANKKIKWIPKEVGEGRFGKWLEGARDWGISRSRFWGSPVPIWRCQNEDCKEKEFFGSVDDIKKRTSNGNTFLIARHGESDSNIKDYINSKIETVNHLTEKGRQQAEEAAEDLKNKKIDVVYCSPFMRTKETVEILANTIGFPMDKIIYDERLHEIYAGELEGANDATYQEYFGSEEAKFVKTIPGGENYTMVKNRMTEFLYDVDAQNKGKNILIVSHKTPIYLMFAGARGLTREQAIRTRTPGIPFIKNSEIKELDFSPIPHNRNYELDLHRPFIDEIQFTCKKCDGNMKRIPEVFDCWFESGSMPYGEMHYPFENADTFDPKKNKRFPADFIAEGLDQTRGWFYTMLILSVALFDESSYKSVIVNGTILAEDGQKMSKHLKNYSDPMDLVSQYSADAMRYCLLSSQAMRAEDMKFSDKSVDEVLKKVIMRLQNVFSFFEMYGGFDVEITEKVSKNILDKWILIRLKEVATAMTEETDNYELDRATRPVADFVDDISTWFLRRSRDRFKSEDADDRNSAMLTTRTVILELSKLIAPSMPFLADDLYLKITGGLLRESVHLENWPDHLVGELSDEEKGILNNMKETRNIVSLGLEVRAKAGIKVRQPLASLKTKSKLTKEYTDLIKDEVNVKEVASDESITDAVELDLDITSELKEEGTMRDIIRSLQEMRKEKGLNPGDLVELVVETNDTGKELIEKFTKEISKTAGLKKISFESTKEGKTVEFDGMTFNLDIR